MDELWALQAKGEKGTIITHDTSILTNGSIVLRSDTAISLCSYDAKADIVSEPI